MTELVDQKTLTLGKDVLRKESQEIQSCSTRLGKGFVNAVNLIYSCKGRVFTSGLGKSGHIARKLSVTLASIGVPSSFLHPTEAMHGDAGTLLTGDVLIAFGHSGENIETLRLCEFCREKGIEVISITGNPSSSLAAKSSHVLDASIESESDPLGVVPTSSSSVSLALGHALTVALMHKLKVNIDSFAKLHPGGTLGAKIASASRYTESPPRLYVGLEAGLNEVLEALQAENLGIVGVKENAKLVGCITDGDIRRAFLKYGKDAFSTPLSEIASKNPVVCTSSDSVWTCIKRMEEKEITSLFMLDESSHSPMGIVRLATLRKE